MSYVKYSTMLQNELLMSELNVTLLS